MFALMDQVEEEKITAAFMDASPATGVPQSANTRAAQAQAFSTAYAPAQPYPPTHAPAHAPPSGSAGGPPGAYAYPVAYAADANGYAIPTSSGTGAPPTQMPASYMAHGVAAPPTPPPNHAGYAPAHHPHAAPYYAQPAYAPPYAPQEGYAAPSPPAHLPQRAQPAGESAEERELRELEESKAI